MGRKVGGAAPTLPQQLLDLVDPKLGSSYQGSTMGADDLICLRIVGNLSKTE